MKIVARVFYFVTNKEDRMRRESRKDILRAIIVIAALMLFTQYCDAQRLYEGPINGVRGIVITHDKNCEEIREEGEWKSFIGYINIESNRITINGESNKYKFIIINSWKDENVYCANLRDKNGKEYQAMWDKSFVLSPSDESCEDSFIISYSFKDKN